MSVMGHVGGFWGTPRRVVLGMLVSVAGALLVAAMAAPTALGSATLNWGTGVPAPLPSDAEANPGVEMHALSCVSTGNCSAIGRYRDGSANRLGLLLTQTNGTWTAVAATLPPGAAADPIAALNAVSCASAGNCSAVGSYRDTSGNTQPVLLTQTSGIWAAGVPASLPSAGSDPQVALNSVSCTSPGNCSAVGDYIDSSGNRQGALLTETSGTWAAGEADLPAAPTVNPKVFLLSVSCASAGNCTAVGEYTDNSGNTQGLLLTQTSGVWATGVNATLPAVPTANPDVVLRSISCVSADTCAVGGWYQDNSGHGDGLLLNETSGVWTAAKATAPADAATEPQSYVWAVSCAAAGSCSAIGGYTDSSASSQGLLLTQSANMWAAGSRTVLPAGAAANPNVSLDSLSCFSAGNCAAIGEFDDSSGTQGLLLSEIAGNWAPAVKASLPADAAANPKAITGDVSCTSVTECTAIGRYNTATTQVGLIFAAANASPALSVSAPSTATIGQAIAGPSVSATLSAGAVPTGGIQFRVFGPQSSPPSSCLTGGSPVGGTVTVSGNGAYHPSAGFTPTVAGTYWWYATYGGDLSDNAAASACGASMASTVVKPASAPVTTPVSRPVLPVVSKFAQSHARWREGSALATISAKRKPPLGTVFTFTLNQAATTKLVFTQGKKVKATLSMTATAGNHKISFQGRLSRKHRLAPGRYAVTITATNANHATSAPKTLSFTIVA
jgi:hypothetical protein